MSYFLSLVWEHAEIHAVVLEKAAEGEGKSRDNAKPARFRDDVAQSEVHGDRRKDCQKREQALTKGQSEKDALLKIPDLFIDLDFYADGTKTADSVYYTIFSKAGKSAGRNLFRPIPQFWRLLSSNDCSFGFCFDGMRVETAFTGR